MDPLQVTRLKEEHKKGLQVCEEKIAQWEKFKKDYETLKERLETLPDALSYNVTVPFGKNAFTMGKIVHTNEVMVLLGDNWFAEVSAKQATDIVERRIKQCSSMLEDFSKEQKQFSNWLSYIDEVSGNENLVEIVEKYDEEQEKKWREQHAENVKAHRRKLAEERKNTNDKSTSSNSEDELQLRLEDLELNEYETKSTAESDGSNFEYSDDGSQHSEEQSIKSLSLKLQINCNNNEKSFHESETGDEVEDSSPGNDISSNQECEDLKNGKHVRWQDLSKQNIKKITFRHSKNKKKPHIKHQESSESEELIQSPSDIYKQFGSFFPSSPPKSILKVKNSPPNPDFCEPFFPVEETIPKTDSPKIKDESVTQAFTGEVYEHSSPVHAVEKKSSRPVSHFKNARKNRKR